LDHPVILGGILLAYRIPPLALILTTASFGTLYNDLRSSCVTSEKRSVFSKEKSVRIRNL
jgi:hypothetical protein